MTQSERRIFLIQELLREHPEGDRVALPQNTDEQQHLLRALMNVRPAIPIDPEVLKIQDKYLQDRVREKGVVSTKELPKIQAKIKLWQGDITRLDADAIVNAANSALLGCFVPNHHCIDNAIQTYAGMQLRAACADIMHKQGHEEATGIAKITSAFNLPAKYVIHTVGPIISGALTKNHEDLLASCYNNCLQLAEDNKLSSIAFCCISTGEFGFPPQRAAEIAVSTVQNYLLSHPQAPEVIFNVFKKSDLAIYQQLLN